jgi:hypothetical protein
MELHNFTLKPDGKIYLVENLPDEPGEMNYPGLTLEQECEEYERRLQSAIDSAVEVSNYNEVWLKIIEHERRNNSFEWTPEVNTPYSLLCSVEDDPFWLLEVNQFGEQSRFHKVFVTFPESGEKKPLPPVVPRMKCCGKTSKDCRCQPEKKEQEQTQEQLIVTLQEKLEQMTFDYEEALRLKGVRDQLLEDIFYNRIKPENIKQKIDDVLNLPF